MSKPKKKITRLINLQIKAGKATPAPPIGPVLGQSGVNIPEFCKSFNAASAGLPAGTPVPVVITVYADRSFSFIMKQPPASYSIMQAAKLEKGSQTPGKGKNIGTITRAQLQEIAKGKMVDMNAYDLDAAVKMLAGSARSAGIEVVN